MMMHGYTFRREAGIGTRHALKGHGAGLDDDVIDTDLDAFLLEQGVDPTARCQQTVYLEIHGQGEVRNIAETLGQALGDDRAHAVKRHKVI